MCLSTPLRRMLVAGNHVQLGSLSGPNTVIRHKKAGQHRIRAVQWLEWAPRLRVCASATRGRSPRALCPLRIGQPAAWQRARQSKATVHRSLLTRLAIDDFENRLGTCPIESQVAVLEVREEGLGLFAL